MSFALQVLIAAVSLLAVTLALASWWLCSSANTPLPTGHQHLLTLDEHTKTHLVCTTIACGFEMDLPRGAPRKLTERLDWARGLGLLPWQNGRSVAFLEALRAD